MINNYWDDLQTSGVKLGSQYISDIHEKLLSEMEIPKWLMLKCPFCGKEQPLRSIRSFGVKLNARNMCDIFVELCCYDCKQMDTLYFRSEIEKIPDFIGFLNGTKSPKNTPVIEEAMYELKYNNMIEKAVTKIKETENGNN